MPKSRRRKGKFTPQSKKRREQVRQPAMPQPPVATGTTEPVSRPRIVTSPTTPATKTITIPATYGNVTTELRTIGILAGVLLVILIVLALFLS